MKKPYRAVLMVLDTPQREVTLAAESDFDALTQAKQVFGAASHFDLWDGKRRALTYKPSAAMRSVTAGDVEPHAGSEVKGT